jgi:serine/threonine protein kinase
MLTAIKAGRYEILGELGRGAMGVVYRAKDPLIGRIVAVKTMRLSEEGTGLSHPELVERFQTEARAAGLLTHPNIVVIYDAGEADGLCYITMELVTGKSLQSMLDSGEKFLLPRLLRIMEQICSALQFAHDNKVVHRDIKPANILLTGDDWVKLTDFGTAKIMQYGVAHQTATTGTPSYMSPEQVKGKAVDGRADIFSVGVMLYEMTTGQKPFRGQDLASVLYKILNEEPVPPHQVNPNISPGVSSTIMKALAKSPFLRYENCRELFDDLKNYRPGEFGASGSVNVSPAPVSHVPSPHPVRDVPARGATGTSFKAEMPKIPGVEARPATALPPRAKPAPAPAAVADDARDDIAPQPYGVYQEPRTNSSLTAVKRFAAIGAGAVLFAMLVSFAVGTIGRNRRSPSEGPLVRQESAPSTAPQSTEADSPRTPVTFVSQSTPEVAAVSELAEPWSCKKFIFRGSALSKNVSAIIIRLPGPAAQSKSYWAFSLGAPFSQCQFEYIDDLAKLSSDYAFAARHPMVANPCSHTVFDPLQLKELPGNILVRGAIVQGFDPRPPLGIELKISNNRILALAME